MKNIKLLFVQSRPEHFEALTFWHNNESKDSNFGL